MASPRPPSSALPPNSSTTTPAKPRRPSATAHSSAAASSARSRFRSASTSTAAGGVGSSSTTTGGGGGGGSSEQHEPAPEPVSHEAGLAQIRSFLRGRSSYDVFPVSFRLIVLDTKLMVKKALGVMWQNGIISAPLWNSETSRFDGMLTVSDIIHLIQYYYHTQTYEGAASDVEGFRLENLRAIERELHVPPPPLLSVHPLVPLFEASQLLQTTHARRLPLIDVDEQTGGDVVLSVLTQYRVLKFIAVNCPITHSLTHPLRALDIGSYVAPDHLRPRGPISPHWPLATATLDTTVFDVVHMFSERGISAVPIVDGEGRVVNLYETVDVITLVRLGAYTSLDLTIAQALARRSPDFPGVVTCTPQDSLANLFQLIRKRRLHRLVVVAGEDDPEGKKKGTLVGIISLSDVMRYIILGGEVEDEGRSGKLDAVGEGHTPDEGSTPPAGSGSGPLGGSGGAGTPGGGEPIEVSTTPTAPPPLPLPLV